MIALIDGDIIVHRVGYTTENEEEWIARARADEMLDGILLDTGSNEFRIFLSDDRDKSFRYGLTVTYKANRTAPRPKHYDAIKEHLIKAWGAQIALGMEADDALGIAQDKSGCETVICSIDKDLLQIPGQHYNFVKKEWESVTEWEGLKWFYKQLLIGDSTDNVEGCRGVGPVKAGKAIDPLGEEVGEEGLYQAVRALYEKHEKGKTQDEITSQILLAGRLLRIKQKEEEPLWHFPSSSPTTEPAASSTLSTPEATTPFMGHTKPERESGSLQHGVSTENTSKGESPELTS